MIGWFFWTTDEHGSARIEKQIRAQAFSDVILSASEESEGH
jgi:hypothetical protein